MFIGHYAPAFALKRARPETPLWLLFVGVQFVDYLWGAFILTGIERAHLEDGHTASNTFSLDFMPFSHSLVAAVLWSVVAGLVAFGAYRAKSPVASGIALAFGASVFSHWLCDLPMHVPDLPLFSDAGPKFGWGLWNHRLASFLFEAVLVAGAAALARRSIPRTQALLWFVGGLSIANVYQYFAPPPPTLTVMCLSALVSYTALAFWASKVDRPA